MAFVSPGPSTATIAMARMRPGIAMIASAIRESTASIHLPA